MNKLREITVFSPGDSSSLTCWSNVPYLFTKALEQRGIRINRVNIYSNKYLRKTIWKYIIEPIVKAVLKEHAFTFEQTRLNRFLTEMKIKVARLKYTQSDLDLFIGYDYPLNKNGRTCVLFCDWTFEYLVTQRRGTIPCHWERKEIERQTQVIEQADCVISLFPDVAQYMHTKYMNRQICYLGQNVINNADEDGLVEKDLLQDKAESMALVFIGREPYLPGAKLLIDSFQKLKERYPQLELHIIGLTSRQFDFLPKDVYCYGYLNKSDLAQRRMYYSILRKARVCINPTPLWAGYSSMVEAMYFYTPVITSMYQSFVDTFGKELEFGYYLQENRIDEISEKIRLLLDCNGEFYRTKAKSAHDAVKEFTWDSFADKFLTKMNQIVDNKTLQK
ncbi:MAG: glycosyltransferase family 4 protein [Parabacteroides sp.]